MLVNGASGGVGSFAVQLARAFGAEVTSVQHGATWKRPSSARGGSRDRLHAGDFADGSVRYDLIVDNVGNRDIGELRRALVPQGIYVAVSGPSEDDHWINKAALAQHRGAARRVRS
ncbi:MAG: hypothetical protein U1F11_11590 [Steroidobacteraceae bacterium]